MDVGKGSNESRQDRKAGSTTWASSGPVFPSNTRGEQDALVSLGHHFVHLSSVDIHASCKPRSRLCEEPSHILCAMTHWRGLCPWDEHLQGAAVSQEMGRAHCICPWAQWQGHGAFFLGSYNLGMQRLILNVKNTYVCARYYEETQKRLDLANQIWILADIPLSLNNARSV